MQNPFMAFITSSADTEKELSVEARMGLIEAAVNTKLNLGAGGDIFNMTRPVNPLPSYYVFKTYDTYVVACRNGDYFKVPYHFEGKEVVVGEAEPVEMAWIPKNPDTQPEMAPSGMKTSIPAYMEKKEEAVTEKGGKGSGNFGHSGRPGHRGGSGPADGGKGGKNFAQMSPDEVVDHALQRGVTNVGQLNKQQVSALRRAVKKGKLFETKNYQYPTPRTMWVRAIQTGEPTKDQKRALDEASIADLAKQPLSSLRRQQAETDRDIEIAYNAHDTVRLEGLQGARKLLDAAVDRKAFGRSSESSRADRPGVVAGIRSPKKTANERRAKVDAEVKALAKKPLAALRRLQGQKDKAIQQAYADKNTAVLKRLQRERRLLDSAIDWREFGSKV